MATMHVRSMYESEFDCPSDEVKVETISAERYRATGCGRTTTYHCFNNMSCVPMESQTAQDDAPLQSSARSASASESDQRTSAQATASKKSGADVKIALDLPIGNKALFKLRAVPAKHGELVQLKLTRIEHDPETANCSIDLMVNGERIAIPKARFSRGNNRTSSLVSDLPLDVVRELGAAQQVALRVCDFRWSLSEDQIGHVRGFVARYREELAWAQDAKQTSGSGLMAPDGGWPAWTVEKTPPAATSSGSALAAEALFTLLSPSVYQVEALLPSGTTQGSAVAVTETELLTNCHVVEGARKIILKQNKREYVATLGRAHPKTDRCVLQVSDPILKPVLGVRSYKELKVGEPVYTLGSPGGLELTIAGGLLSGLREENDRRFVQTTAPISPGSSGGGLFDARGNLVGITTLVLLNKQRTMQSLNFAVAAETFWQP